MIRIVSYRVCRQEVHTAEFGTVYFDFNLIEADPDDNKFVDCAITAGARYVVTEDHHYDVIKWKDFPGLEVIGLDDFLRHLKKEGNS